MRTTRLTQSNFGGLPDQLREGFARRLRDTLGITLIVLAIAHALALATWSVGDPSLSTTGTGKVSNLLGYPGAVIADLSMQLIGLGSIALAVALGAMGLRLLIVSAATGWKWRLAVAMIGVLAAACLASALPATERWPLPTGLGGALGDGLLQIVGILGLAVDGPVRVLAVIVAAFALVLAFYVQFRGLTSREEADLDDEEDERDEEPSFAILMLGALLHFGYVLKGFIARLLPDRAGRPGLKTRLRDFLSTRQRGGEPGNSHDASLYSCRLAPRARQASRCRRICSSPSSVRLLPPAPKRRDPNRPRLTPIRFRRPRTMTISSRSRSRRA